MPYYNKMLPLMKMCDWWQSCLTKDTKKLVVGMPILWFGDVNAYFESEKRVVTIGINPSDMEFSKHRFGTVKKMSNNGTYRDYFDALNNYFGVNPFDKWFKNFEKILNFPQIKATYGGKMAPTPNKFPNTAIHIDFHSPLATKVTWSGLIYEAQKDAVSNHCLFLELIKILNPDIILVSLSSPAKDSIIQGIDVNGIFPPFNLSAKNSPRKGLNYERWKNGQGKEIIFGTNMNGQPFTGISTEELKKIIKDLFGDENQL